VETSVLLRVLIQNNNHCKEKHGWYISLQKIQAAAMVPKHSLPVYCRMLHLNKKRRIRDGHLTNITSKQREKADNAPRPIDAVLKSVKS